MSDLIYLGDSVEATIDRLIQDEDFKDCGLTRENLERTVRSFRGDEIACSVFLKKYALRDENNQIVEFTLDEAKDRWAKGIAVAEGLFPDQTQDGRSIEKKTENYFRELYDYFLPAGRQMFALGNHVLKNLTYSNCYATSIEEDSIEGIFDCAKKLAKTYSYGGGIGTCIGTLRPKKSAVSNSARFSTGAVSFMELFSLTTGLIGQCIAEGQQVLTKNGLKPIEKVKIGEEVWTKEGFVKVINNFNNGKKEIVKIKDEFGYELKATENHIIACEENGEIIEKRISELEIGDSVILIPGTPNNNEYVKLEYHNYIKKNSGNKSNKLNEEVLFPEILNEKLAYVLGYSYGDGSVEYDGFNEPHSLSLACADSWPEIKIQLKEYIKDVFNYDAYVKNGDGCLEIYAIYSKLIMNFLQHNNLLKQKAHELAFPEKIINSPTSVQMAFISGFFDADGKKVNGKRGYAISITAYKFLQNIKQVLMSNGIVSRNNYENRKDQGWRDLHGITIAGKSSQSKARELLNMSVKVRNANFIAKRDNYLTPYKAKSLNIKTNDYSFVPDNYHYLSAGCFDRLVKEGKVSKQLLIKSFISNIENCGEAKTYDLQLEKEHMFYCEGFYVHNSGRRGALMISIPVDHPDIEDFIEIKHNNIDKVKHANISVKLTDDFMNAVLEDGDFELSFKTSHETIKKVVKAKELWNKIIKSARDSAEPGLLFWDNATKMSPSDIYPSMKVHTTNPCVSGDTWVATENGAKLVKDLLNKDVNVLVDGKVYNSINGFFETGEKECFNLKTGIGFSGEFTEDHEIKILENNEKVWRKVKDLKHGDNIILHNHRRSIPLDENDWHEGYLMGCLLGDGTIKQNGAILSVFNMSKEDGVRGIEEQVLNSINYLGLKKRADFNGWIKVSDRDEKRLKLKSIDSIADKYGLFFRNKQINKNIEGASYSFCRGFCRGLFDADGSVQGSSINGRTIRLSQSNLDTLKSTQRILSRLGIISVIYENRRSSCFRNLPNGRGGLKKYFTKANHELIISKDNLLVFNDMVGFGHYDKQNKLDAFINSYSVGPKKEKFTTFVMTIESIGMKKVYDIIVPNINAFDANGIYVHNCGEQLLQPGGSCTLSSLLLHTFVKNPYTENAEFDFELFKEMTRRGVRHLDNITELNLGHHALEEQERAAIEGRRIGLGMTGLADTYAALNIKYDTQEALEFTEKMMKIKMEAEYNASIDLSVERGPFALFDANKHFEQGFCAQLPEHIKDKGRRCGLRNVAISTVAPNGSLSIMAQCSGGIEPIFCFAYKRYVQMGGERREFTVRHQGIARFHEVNGDQDLPDYWVASHEIDYNYRVKLQGLIQKYIDSSISSTINLPEDVNEEVVGQIYIDAWKEGLKGITVYREGSREGVLVTEDFASQAGIPMMDTVIKCVRAEGGDKFYIMISYKNQDVKKPYQVFVLNYKKGDKESFVKTSNAVINMLKERGVEQERINKYTERSTNSLSKLTRFISLSMKTGNLSECVGVLKQHSFVGTLVSKLYDILKVSVEIGKAKCASCGSDNLKMEEGCSVCNDCGASGCG